MAGNRPEAVLDFKLSASHPIQEVNTVTTIITPSAISTITTCTSPVVAVNGFSPAPPSNSGGTNAATAPTPPLRPPRGHGSNLVQPKGELQPAPPAAGVVANRSSAGAGGIVGVRKSTCKKCTNISIMQLFYEMKQRFPTVPDDVVNECVLDNCHDRERCLKVLKEHSEGNHTLIPQSYPAKLLRAAGSNFQHSSGGGGGGHDGHNKEVNGGGGDQQKCDRKSNNNSNDRQSNTNTIPRRSKGGGGGGAIGAALVAAAVPLVGMVSGSHFRRQSDTNSPKVAVSSCDHERSSDLLSNGGSFISNNIQRMAKGGSGGEGGASPVGNKVERPRTLNLSSSPNRPFRAAPPIPSTTSSTSSLSSLSTATDLASASSPQLTASNESINVSVNVTLSPILTPRTTTSAAAATATTGQHVSKPPIPPRHTTELTVQPEILPFATTTTAGMGSGGMPTRSFTSVNFMLRQPGTGAAVGSGSGMGAEGSSGVGGGGTAGFPIDITTAGSSMTYSSSSYNAKQGYQSQLQITVGNGGGSISAIRTRAPTIVTTTSSAATPSTSGLLAGNRNPIRLDADSEEILINRQLQSKWKLSTELDKYKKRLDVMQRDVKTLQMPLPASAPAQLQEEIERLQTVCDRMAAAVEEAGNFALGETNEAFYQRLDSQTSSAGSSNSQAAAAQRPPRPNPPSTSGGGMAASNSSTTPVTENNSVSAVEDNEAETEGWTCSQCTFQNHPELNMCEQCGMVKRPPPPQQMHRQQQQQQQQSQQSQSHLQQPAGIVQITSSQFIPAPVPNASANNQSTAHLAGVPSSSSGVMLTNNNHHHNSNNSSNSPNMPQQYMIRYPSQTPSPRIVYSSPMCQYPPAFGYPSMGTPTTNPGAATATTTTSSNAHSPVVMGQQLLPPPTVSPSCSGRSPKGKRGSKFNSKFSQSISNLFSSSSSSSSSTSHSHVNSQE